MNYEQFHNTIALEKRKHCVPNVIYSDEIATLGKLNNHKDVQKIPIRNQWCIKSSHKFSEYVRKGYDFYVIYLPNEPLPFTFVVVAIVNGDVEYYDVNDYEQLEDIGRGMENESDHSVYQNKLPKPIVQ